jgi:hypothetical protein
VLRGAAARVRRRPRSAGAAGRGTRAARRAIGGPGHERAARGAADRDAADPTQRKARRCGELSRITPPGPTG